MKQVQQAMAAMAAGIVLVSAASGQAQDWPQWRGSQRDGKVTGFTAPEKWPSALTQQWKATVGTGDATPALVGDKLFVFARQGEEEVLSCLSAADGKELWRNKYTAQAVTGAAARHPGPRSSPEVVDGKVITFGVGGVLSCFDAATGKQLWQKDEFPKVVPRFFTSVSPIVADGMVVAQLGGTGNGAIMAFDLATGNVKWKWAEEGPGYASPVLLLAAGTKQIVTLTDKSVVGIGLADGKGCWQIPFAPSGMGYNAATPIVDGDTVIFTGQGRGTKAVKIEKTGAGFVAKELWSSPVGTQYNSPVLKDGRLFGLSDKGNLFCLNAKTGETLWIDTAKLSSFGSIVDAGSVLMAMSEKNGLIVFKPEGAQYAELARIKVSDAPVYAYPVVAGKRIIVKDNETVILGTLE